MQKKIIFIGFLLTIASSFQLKAQYSTEESDYKRWFVGSSLFVLAGNLSTTNPPNFVQLNLGYRLTGKDVITLEPKTWKYAWPNGIHPFLNKAYGKPEEKFPGYVREFGLSLAYQRFFWKGLYTELNVMPTLQTFSNDEGNKIDNGLHPHRKSKVQDSRKNRKNVNVINFAAVKGYQFQKTPNRARNIKIAVIHCF